MASVNLKMRQGEIVPFVFERDYLEFIQLEISRFDQPMTRTLLEFLKKRYGHEFWYSVDIRGNQRIDGYVIAGPEMDERQLPVVHVYSIAIRKEFEGQGWAKKLMLHLIANAKASGKDAIVLEVRDNNDRALGFYLSLGFEITGREDNYYDEDIDAITMRYELRNRKSLE